MYWRRIENIVYDMFREKKGGESGDRRVVGSWWWEYIKGYSLYIKLFDFFFLNIYV